MRPSAQRRIVGRDSNVVRVDFRNQPDPPAPRFPGAGAMRAIDSEDDSGGYLPRVRQPCEMNLVTR